MAERILSGKIKQLVYTTEELSQSPLSTTVIDNGVLVYEKTSSGQIKCKIGDGNNVWSGLNYIDGNSENNNDFIVANIDNEVNYKVNSLNIISNCNYEWKEDVELPYKCVNSGAVILNNELHILGSSYKNFNYNILKFINSNVEETLDFGDIPYEFTQGNAIVYNNEIHILGGYNSQTSHYKFNSKTLTWEEVSTLPYDFYDGNAIVYNNEIHILGGYYNKKKHYKWDGLTWTEVSTLPYGFYNGAICNYNNEIHILGGYSSSYNTKHYKWDGLTWTEVSTLPYSNDKRFNVIINDNKIYMFNNSSYIYIWDGEIWSSIYNSTDRTNSVILYNNIFYIFGCYDITSEHSNIYSFNGNNNEKIKTINYYNLSNCNPLIYDDNIYIFDSKYIETYKTSHYKLNSETLTWEEVSTLPYDFSKQSILYNNEIHILGDHYSITNYHYKFNSETLTWEEVSTLPYYFRRGSIVVYNDEIHILGSNYSTYKTSHYKFNSETLTWEEVSTLPYDFYDGNAIVYNNEIHILGNYNDSTTKTSHYKFNSKTLTWEEVSTLPYDFSNGGAFVYNNEIHILGGGNTSDTRTYHYKFNSSTSSWVELDVLPYRFYDSSSIIYNNKIHILGSSNEFNYKSHYSYGKDMSDLSNADILTITIDDNKEVPLLKNKMDKINPTGTGSFSMNRAEGSTIGENSVALGSENIASYDYSSAIGECCVSGNYNRYQFNMSKITENDITKIQLKITGEDSNQIFSENDDVFIILEQDNKHRLYKCKILSVTVTDGLNNDYDHYLIIEDKNNYFSSMNSFHGYLFKSFDVTGSRNINYSHSEGYSCLSSGYCSHAEGEETNATSYGSHAEGYNTYANGVYSHAEGDSCRANGNYSHAEGEYSYANGNLSHAENHSYANGSCSHSEGYTCKANGEGSHAEGDYTVANGIYSHSEGEETIASSDFQHVQGMYNVEDTSDTYAHIVGGGTSNDDRKNIHTLDWNGNAVFSGDVTATKSDGTEVSLLSLKSTLDSIQVQNFYTGIEAPSNTLGEDGDLYLIT